MDLRTEVPALLLYEKGGELYKIGVIYGPTPKTPRNRIADMTREYLRRSDDRLDLAVVIVGGSEPLREKAESGVSRTELFGEAERRGMEVRPGDRNTPWVVRPKTNGQG